MSFPCFVLVESRSHQSVPIDIMAFVSHVLPPLLGYFFVAVLAVTPQTHILRVALWPVITLFALRAAVSVDMSLGEPDRKFRNTLFVVSFSFITNSTQAVESRSLLHPVFDDPHSHPYLRLDIGERAARAAPSSREGF